MMLEVQKTKNQHTVPQGYLKPFTYYGKRLYVFDKYTQRWNSRSTKSVASLPYFYDFPEDVRMDFGDPQLVEHIFSGIEPIFYNLRDDVLRTIDRQGRITGKQRVAMSYFMAVQYLRTVEQRRNLTEMVRGVGSAAAQLVPEGEKKTPALPEMWDEYNIALGHAGILFPPDMLYSQVQVLRNHIWTVGVNENEGAHPLYTSDAPVVMKAHSARPGGIGLGSLGIEIAFPLTPRCLLVLWERTVFGNLVSLDGTVHSLTSERVRYYNRLQTLRSYQYVCSSSPDFSVAQQTCQRLPDVCHPDQARLRIQSVRTSPQKMFVHLVWPDPDRSQHEVH